MGDSDGNQLLGLGCQRTLGEDLSAECLECVVRPRRKPLRHASGGGELYVMETPEQLLGVED
jgi:hypothetical protein